MGLGSWATRKLLLMWGSLVLGPWAAMEKSDLLEVGQAGQSYLWVVRAISR